MVSEVKSGVASEVISEVASEVISGVEGGYDSLDQSVHSSFLLTEDKISLRYDYYSSI